MSFVTHPKQKVETDTFKVSAKPERSSRITHTTKQKLRHTLHQLLKDKWWGKLCRTLGINERQNWSNQEWMSPIITMVNNPFCSLSPLVIHFKWNAGNLEPEERGLPCTGKKRRFILTPCPYRNENESLHCTGNKRTEEGKFEWLCCFHYSKNKTFFWSVGKKSLSRTQRKN